MITLSQYSDIQDKQLAFNKINDTEVEEELKKHSTYKWRQKE